MEEEIKEHPQTQSEQKSKIESASPESTTIKQSLKEIDEMLNKGNELLKGYVNEIDELKTEVAKMEGAVLSVVLESDKSTGPILASNMETLISKVNLQKDENAKLQKQLTDLRKEKAQTQQTIYALEGRIGTLEKEYGIN